MPETEPPSDGAVAVAVPSAQPVVAGVRFGIPVASTSSSALSDASNIPGSDASECVQPGFQRAKDDRATESSSGDDADAWRFTVAIGGWLPKMDGKVGADGSAERVSLSYHDVYDLITDNYKTGGFWSGSASYDGWTVFTNGMFWDLDDSELFDVSLGPFELDDKIHAELDLTIANFGAKFDLGATPELGVGAGPVAWRGLVGGRYISTETKLELSATHSLTGETTKRNEHGSQSWVDAVVGLEATLPLGDGWSIIGDGDFGGWGIGSSSKRTWRLTGMLNYRASELVSIDVGWSCVAFDHESGSGAGKETVDLRLTGPRAAITFHF